MLYKTIILFIFSYWRRIHWKKRCYVNTCYHLRSCRLTQKILKKVWKQKNYICKSKANTRKNYGTNCSVSSDIVWKSSLTVYDFDLIGRGILSELVFSGKNHDRKFKESQIIQRKVGNFFHLLLAQLYFEYLITKLIFDSLNYVPCRNIDTMSIQ